MVIMQENTYIGLLIKFVEEMKINIFNGRFN